MRKAAFAVGIICAVFAVVAVVLRVIELPGSAVLFVVFTSLFSVAGLGLYLGAQLRESRTFLRKVALAVLWLGLTDLQVGLLYGAMSWPGVATILWQGVAMSITGILIYFFAGKNQETKAKVYPVFVIAGIVVYSALGLGWATAKERKLLGPEHLANYQSEFLAYQADSSALQNAERLFLKDTANDAFVGDAQLFFTRTEELIRQIDQVKQALIEENKRQFICAEGDSCGVLNKPEDFDLSTMMMVGTDVEKPSGRGMEIYSSLLKFRTIELHPDIDFVIPVSPDQIQKEQWVKDNFYHLPTIDVLTRLLVIQKNITQSAMSTIEKKQFVHQQ